MEKEWYGLEKNRNLYLHFRESLDKTYFGDNSTISLIDDRIPEYFDRLRDNNNILVTLNTGYDIIFQIFYHNIINENI